MALSLYAGVCYDCDLFLTLDYTFMRSRGTIILQIKNIKRTYISEVYLYKGRLNEERWQRVRVFNGVLVSKLVSKMLHAPPGVYIGSSRMAERKR